MSDTMQDTSPVIPGAVSITYRHHVWTEPERGFTYHLANDDRYAVTIWEEAHAEHARRFPTPVTEVPTREVELEREVTRLQEQVSRLQTEQIRGSDPRLTDFWEQAQSIADDAEYCEVFDNLAEELGGPRRKRSFTFNVTLSVEIETRNPDSIGRHEIEQAIYGMGHDSLYGAIDDYNYDN